MTYERKKYNPGYIDCYQKPWFSILGWNIVYCGQFAPKGRPNEIYMSNEPLRKLINRVEDVKLREEFTDLVEEMEDACRMCRSEAIKSLPSADD